MGANAMGAEMSDLLKPEQVAQRVQVSRRTVIRAINSGELEASQLAERGCWRIKPEAVDAWVELRSNRHRAPRPMPDVVPVSAAAAAAQRARRQGAGTLRVTPDMGRAA